MRIELRTLTNTPAALLHDPLLHQSVSSPSRALQRHRAPVRPRPDVTQATRSGWLNCPARRAWHTRPSSSFASPIARAAAQKASHRCPGSVGCAPRRSGSND